MRKGFYVLFVISLMCSLAPSADAIRIGRRSGDQGHRVLVELVGVEDGDIVHFLYDDGYVKARVRYAYPALKKAIVEVPSKEDEKLVLKAGIEKTSFIIKGELKKAIERAQKLVAKGDRWLDAKNYKDAMECYKQAIAIEIHPRYHKTTGKKLLAAKSMEKESKISSKITKATSAFKQKIWQGAMLLCKEAIGMYRNLGEDELAILGYTESKVQEGIQHCNEVIASAEKHKLEEEKLFAEWCLKSRIPVEHGEAWLLKEISDRRKKKYPDRYCEACNGTGATRCPKCLGRRSVTVIDCKECLAGKVLCGTCKGKGKITCNECVGKGNKMEPCPACLEKGSTKCSKCLGAGSVNCRICKGKGKKLCRECVEGRIQCPVCDGGGKIQVMLDGSPHRIPCPKCKGIGRVDCHYCGGTGRVTCIECDETGKVMCRECNGRGSFLCKKCNGNGKISVTCSKCRGRGKVECLSCNGAGKLTCPHCHGHCGHVEDCPMCRARGLIRCPSCNGKGVVRHRR